jgi:putative transposase
MNYKRVFEPGYSYYFTLVTYRRKPYLVQYIDALREAFKHSKKRYSYRIEAIVIMPDHLHMIITPLHVEEYPDIIKQIKRSFVYNLPNAIKKEAKMELSSSQYRRDHSGIWQSRYYEHAIRDEKDIFEKMQYIRNNPVKHNVCDQYDRWKYSSFYRE